MKGNYERVKKKKKLAPYQVGRIALFQADPIRVLKLVDLRMTPLADTLELLTSEEDHLACRARN